MPRYARVGERRFGFLKWILYIICSTTATALLYFMVISPALGEGIASFIISGIGGAIFGLVLSILLMFLFVGQLKLEIPE